VGGTVNARDAGYLTDVEYTGEFYDHLAPAQLAYIAAINGFQPPRLDQPFTWCELGCGRGVSALVLAAMHPHGEFHACDFNPAHVEAAEALRRAAGVDNVRFHAKSIGAMLREPLPAFDFVVLHGVYSWVPPAVRAEIAEFLRTRVKPGGLAMVSYNAMPGWAGLHPLRQMMRAYAEAVPGNSLDKARAAFHYLRAAAQAGAASLVALPGAAAHLEAMAKQDIRYIAHEYLTPHGDPFYFAEVESAMRAAGLAFAGSTAAADSYPELALPARFQSLLPPGQPRATVEAHRDFVLNTTFRRDVYVAQGTASAGPLTAERLQGLAFCLTDLPERLPLKRSEGALRYDLEAEAADVRRMHARLEQGPAGAREIEPSAIEQLVVAGHLAPCAALRAPNGWPGVSSALVETALREHWPRLPLACPASGSAIYGEPVSAAAIEAARCGDQRTAGDALLARLRRHAHPVNRHDAAGARPATDDEVRAYAATTWAGLRQPASEDARRLRLFGLLS
jgi:predicted O-methyltransferase YrrM